MHVFLLNHEDLDHEKLLSERILQIFASFLLLFSPLPYPPEETRCPCD